ncbi:hypothetical protein [Cryobacterium sp. PH31-L1]|uniref:hypothetical protein n=1 Tax=Cryobacterium sp. PH31-L1 TaxID=3046199 RepID=UPI0024B9CF14|nr:hypothetical protein [Cryobacterium sp. PH31-L1]MDJ0376195.1 hypothetical protein [Cryobacterium sp. PH31-L1]
MSAAARNRFVLGSALVVATGMVIFWVYSPGFSIANSEFDINAHATIIGPLSPGVSVPIDLKFDNPHQFNLDVTDLRVLIDNVDAPNADADHPCTVVDFEVSQISLAVALTIPAHLTRALSELDLPRASWPQVGMRRSKNNQDGCKGALITLDYSAAGAATLL